MKQIHTVEEFQQLMDSTKPFHLLKHSNTCPISEAGYKEFEKFVSDTADISACYLVVQNARPLSNYIAETFQIKHESPQALLFTNKKVVWHASHWKITYDSLVQSFKQ